jgi:hypothetical protein
MSKHDSDDLYVGEVVGTSQVDPSESLTGDNTEDPLDAGYSPPERESHSWRGETGAESSEGESLDEKLAEEEPDITEADLDAVDQEPRSGRLVAPDEGAHPDEESDEIATDVGRDGQAASAEEAAMHIVDDDQP